MWQPSLYSSWIVIVSHKICSSRSGSFGRVLRVLSIVQFTRMWHYRLQSGTEKTFCNDTKLNVQEKYGIQRKYFETKIFYDFMSFVFEDIELRIRVYWCFYCAYIVSCSYTDKNCVIHCHIF